MSEIIGKPNLFKHSYYNERPKEFGFLLRPTDSEFNDFILLLDKMMSDNINKRFFENDVDLETEEERDDGKIIIADFMFANDMEREKCISNLQINGREDLLDVITYKYYTNVESLEKYIKSLNCKIKLYDGLLVYIRCAASESHRQSL